MRQRVEHLPVHQSMRGAHRVRRFRRSNSPHGRGYLGHKQKPWKKESD